MTYSKAKADDPIEVLYKEAKYKRYQRHYYRNLVLRSVSSFFIGLILMAFLEAFGFPGLIIGLALCGFGALFAISC